MNPKKLLAIYEWEADLPTETRYLLQEVISAGHYEVIKSWLEYTKLSDTCKYNNVTKSDVYNYLTEMEDEV